MNRDEALAHAISNAEAAERLLAADRALSGSTLGGHARDAEEGPYGVFEEQRAARYAGASAHAETARAWAAIAPLLATPGETNAEAAQARLRSGADRRSRTWISDQD
jgi:hypothetical protein